ncbi:MAG TPA: ABC transporter ATP-binding protein [Polyangiaceae bacterium]|nr:ABC transporter ATP-binding protein [Polyangiaceae bacterium]
MADAVLQLESVVKDYGDKIRTRVLHGIDLTIEAGEFTALIGPSGSGKSTLLNLVGLLDRPTAGKIHVDGVDTGSLDDDGLTRLRGQRIGFIFQFHHLLPEFTAQENVYLPMYSVQGRVTPQMRDRAMALLRRVGLEPQANNRATDLSGGQQQRVAIARSLCMQPPLVLADEPTGNLDTHSADRIFELLRQVNQEQRTAFLVVTHDRRLAARCDRIIELVDGMIVSDRANRPTR